MNMIKFIVITICIFCFSSCADFYAGSDDPSNIQSIKTGTRIDFANFKKIPRVQTGFDLSYNMALQSNGDIWATGGWNTRGDHVYRWSVGNSQWHAVKLPESGMSVSAKVYFANPQNGWIIGRDSILQTRDGGNNWQSLELDKNSAITDLQEVNFSDSENGFIAGTTGYIDRTTFESAQGIEILCTSNGGKDFQICYKNKQQSSVLEIVNLKQGGSIALIDGSKIILTNDRGKNWTEKKLLKTANAITVDNNDAVWIIVDHREFLRSHDLGNSWNETKLEAADISTGVWNSIAFAENGFGIAVGDRGMFAVSADGQNWRVIKSDKINEDLYKIQISGSKVVVQGKDNIYSIDIKN